MTDTNIKPFKRQVWAHAKLPRVDHIDTSYAIQVRDNIVDRMKVMPYFVKWHFVKNKNYQVQPQDVPHAGVYFIDETLSPDSNENAGEIRFQSVVQIGFTIVVQNNDSDLAETELDRAYQTLTNGIYCDPSMYLLHGHRTLIQAYRAGHRSHEFGSIGRENELPIAELRFTLQIELGALTYEPFIPDVFETMNVRTVYPYPEEPGRQEVVSQYDMEENEDAIE